MLIVLWALLGFGVGVWAHEPYLQVTANAEGTFTAEAGFSDGSDVAGLTLLVRDRATGATLSEQALPAGGKMTLPIPAVAYRVTFDGGPGHKVSKIGPERLAATTAVATGMALNETRAENAAQRARAAVDEPEFSRMLMVVASIFLLAVVSFALGFLAASRRTAAR